MTKGRLPTTMLLRVVQRSVEVSDLNPEAGTNLITRPGAERIRTPCWQITWLFTYIGCRLQTACVDCSGLAATSDPLGTHRSF